MTREPDPNQRKALGRGLSALLPSRPTPAERVETPAATATVRQNVPEYFEEFQTIPLDQILPGEQQPRSGFDSEKLAELSQSIKVHGVIQPITVYREKPERYRIVAGERRWSASRLAGLKEIPALIRTVDQHQRLELALIENLQREDLNPIEIASAFQRLADEHGLSHERIAERTGKDRSTITNFLRLLRLSPYVRAELASGAVSVGHARALLNLTDEEAQRQLCDEIVAKQLSVRAVEAIVKRLTTAASSSPDRPQTQEPKVDPNVRAALDEMARALGTKVKLIQKSDGAGRLEIEFYSQDDLDRIYSVIVKQ
jgi:ParB family transcriptional regulator, chromosome partitioning protein